MRRFCSIVLLSLSFAATAAATPTADVSLVQTSVTLVQTGDTAWTLEKEGLFDPANSTVYWMVRAIQGMSTPGQLLLQGQMTVINTGSGPATIGNIVVNLQTRVGKKWVTQSSNVAKATDGDDATSAFIHAQASSEGLGSFSENSASGSLQFMDATNNTVFSLVPQVLVGPGETRTLLFQATFDNNELGLPVGTSGRSEVIVSFGNATRGGKSAANVDINGNGTIDDDEDRVRSVPSRKGLKVPAPVDGNASVTLTDTIDDIATSGTVTFSNAQFNLGATSGTVTVTVDGGTDGGSITNCAHLTGASQTVGSGGFTFPMINGVDETDCSTITIGGTPSCTPGAPGCGWSVGDVVTYSQGQWGGDSGSSVAAALLASQFFNVYGGIFEIGLSGSGFSAVFTSATRLLLYLPASGTPGAFTGDLANPTTTSADSLGGQVAALKLNVDFSAADLTGGTASVNFGDLRICGVTGFNNQTVNQILAAANTTLGGNSSGFSAAALNALISDLNGAFVGGGLSTFAQTSLVNGACP